MDPLQLLNDKIANFPGYATDDARKVSDEEVRSYLGEALADIEARLALADPGSAQQIGDLLLRVGFTNQAVYHAYEEKARNAHGPFDGVPDADARVIELAQRAAQVDAAGLSAYLAEAASALDARDAAMGGKTPAVS
jgi:hypothetical protein